MSRSPFAVRAAIAAATLACLPTLTPASPAVDQARYDAVYAREKARCAPITHPEKRDACLEDANVAAAAKVPRRTADPRRYASNALERCKALPADLRVDCQLRMQGEGSTSGSVAGGGIYRELRSREAG